MTHHIRFELGKWIETEWIPSHQSTEWITLVSKNECVNSEILSYFREPIPLWNDYYFHSLKTLTSSATAPIFDSWQGNSGGFLYQFTKPKAKPVEVAVLSSWDHMGQLQVLACVPIEFIELWHAFEQECHRQLMLTRPDNRVHVIGGHINWYIPNVELEDVILPDTLKTELLSDIDAFLTKGVEIYKSLKLNPFRKLLLAGVPGTGKTMLCSAIARWALAKGCLVLYISGVDQYGSQFFKIEEAVRKAAASGRATIILVEEIDTFLIEPKSKSAVLNVLDGVESTINPSGTLLIATTNRPEAIDDRILRRPGRLDRIFIIPEIKESILAEMLLKRYLGDQWNEDFSPLSNELLGFPSAFVREGAILALTQFATSGEVRMPYTLLQETFNRLKEQINERDEFIERYSPEASNIRSAYLSYENDDYEVEDDL